MSRPWRLVLIRPQGRPRKLTGDQVEMAKRALDAHIPVREVAKCYGVDVSTLYRALARERATKKVDSHGPTLRPSEARPPL